MGRFVWTRSLAVLLLAASVMAVGPAPVSAEPPSTSGPAILVAGAEEPSGMAWRKVSGGRFHTCGIRMDRTLWCWGENAYGQLGVGDTERRLVPTRVGDADWVRIWTSYDHTCGIRTDRSLWCWGWGRYGQLGLGDDLSDRLVPTRVGADADWLRVSTGALHTCGVRMDRSLWCWGQNDYGQLGLGDEITRLVPTRVGAKTGWWVLGGDRHTCGVRPAGSLWCWGANYYGQVGIGYEQQVEVPTRVLGPDWARVTAGGEHTCGLRTDGSLWCWGGNYAGQIGVGDYHHKYVPIRVGAEVDWTNRMTAGWLHTCGVRTDGSLWCWGANSAGQLGLGERSYSKPVPTRVGADISWMRLAAGARHTCALRTDRILWCWGLNDHGQLGLGDLTDRLVPTQV